MRMYIAYAICKYGEPLARWQGRYPLAMAKLESLLHADFQCTVAPAAGVPAGAEAPGCHLALPGGPSVGQVSRGRGGVCLHAELGGCRPEARCHTC